MTPASSGGTPSPGASTLSQLRIVWLAFAGAVLLYGATLAYLETQPVERERRQLPPAQEAVLVLIGAACGVGAIWWRRRELRVRGVSATGVPGPGWTWDHLRTVAILCWAFAESVAIHGLVLGFLRNSLALYVPFGIASLLLLVANRPATWPLPRDGRR